MLSWATGTFQTSKIKSATAMRRSPIDSDTFNKFMSATEGVGQSEVINAICTTSRSNGLLVGMYRRFASISIKSGAPELVGTPALGPVPGKDLAWGGLFSVLLQGVLDMLGWDTHAEIPELPHVELDADVTPLAGPGAIERDMRFKTQREAITGTPRFGTRTQFVLEGPVAVDSEGILIVREMAMYLKGPFYGKLSGNLLVMKRKPDILPFAKELDKVRSYYEADVEVGLAYTALEQAIASIRPQWGRWANKQDTFAAAADMHGFAHQPKTQTDLADVFTSMLKEDSRMSVIVGDTSVMSGFDEEKQERVIATPDYTVFDRKFTSEFAHLVGSAFLKSSGFTNAELKALNAALSVEVKDVHDMHSYCIIRETDSDHAGRTMKETMLALAYVHGVPKEQVASAEAEVRPKKRSRQAGAKATATSPENVEKAFARRSSDPTSRCSTSAPCASDGTA